MTAISTALVIGFPSLISQKVAVRLLESGHRVILLAPDVQHRDAASMKSQFGKLLQLCAGSGDRLDFGLEGKEYLKISKEVSFVFCTFGPHGPTAERRFSAALVQELVEFCKVAPGIERLLLQSDFSFARLFGGVVGEHDFHLPLSAANEKATLLSGQFHLEKIVRKFQRTIPISIARLGTLVGAPVTPFPAVAMAVAYSELFSRSDKSLFFAELNWAAEQLVNIAMRTEPGQTFHLFQQTGRLHAIGAELGHAALSQVPRSFNLRSAARRFLQQNGDTAKLLHDAQVEAKVQNSWTNRCFQEHNFSNGSKALDWQPIVENEVEMMTGFK